MSDLYCPPAWTVRPDGGGKVGVVCGSALWVFENTDPRPARGMAPGPFCLPLAEAAHDVGALTDLAYAHRIGSVWLVPRQGSQPRQGDPPLLWQWPRGLSARSLGEQRPDIQWHELTARGSRGSAAQLGGLIAQRRSEEGPGRGSLVRLYVPSVQDAWRLKLADFPGDDAARARMIASALLLVQHTLGVQLRFSPSYTGLVLFRAITCRRPLAGVDLAPPAGEWLDWLMKHPAPAVQWRRPLAAAEELAAIHKYDRNWSYISSAREVPVGDPVRTSAYQPGRPGVYCISARAPATWSPRLPGLFHVGQGAGDYPRDVREVWAWEPQIRLAVKLGWAIEIHQGYVWPAKHDLFRPWQERLWQARRELRGLEGPAARAAERIVGHIGRAAIGRLRQRSGVSVRSLQEAEELGLEVQWVDVDEEGPAGTAEVRDQPGRVDLVQPHWWSTIIANAAERLVNAVCTYAAEDTVALHVDALYTLRQHEELAGDPLKVGGFRYQGRAVLEREELAAGGSSAQLATRYARAIGSTEEGGE